MLERNRGARRDRTRHIKSRGLRFVISEVEELNKPLYNAYYTYSVNGHYRLGDDREVGRDATVAEIKGICRNFLRHEGRHNFRDNKCGDCGIGSGHCDYCYGGTKHKQQRLEDAAKSDFQLWESGGAAADYELREYVTV